MISVDFSCVYKMLMYLIKAAEYSYIKRLTLETELDVFLIVATLKNFYRPHFSSIVPKFTSRVFDGKKISLNFVSDVCLFFI